MIDHYSLDRIYTLLLKIQIHKGDPMTQETMELVQEADKETSSLLKEGAKSKRIKVSVYLPEEVEKTLVELYITRYRNDRKIDKSTIVAEAIMALAKQELG